MFVSEVLEKLADFALTFWPWRTDHDEPRPPAPPDPLAPGNEAPTSVPPTGRQPPTDS
jgi:hypothetical protein